MIFRREGLRAISAAALSVTGAIVMTLVLAPRVDAEPASPWQKGFNSKARLIAGKNPEITQPDKFLAGINIKLDPGWKTYWRHPGGAGVPPLFDWKNSKNLKRAKVLYPAPQRLKDAYGTSIGYKKEVVFPVVIEAEKADQPVEIDVTVTYGVCKDICIPAENRFQLRVEPDKLSGNLLLDNFLARVPQPANAKMVASSGDMQDRMMTVQAAKAVLDGKTPHLLIDVKFPENVGGRDLFIEAGDDFYIPVTRHQKTLESGVERYLVDLRGADDPKLLRGRRLRLTLVCDGGQEELNWQIQ